jgi:hypothetical protein
MILSADGSPFLGIKIVSTIDGMMAALSEDTDVERVTEALIFTVRLELAERHARKSRLVQNMCIAYLTLSKWRSRLWFQKERSILHPPRPTEAGGQSRCASTRNSGSVIR